VAEDWDVRVDPFDPSTVRFERGGRAQVTVDVDDVDELLNEVDLTEEIKRQAQELEDHFIREAWEDRDAFLTRFDENGVERRRDVRVTVYRCTYCKHSVWFEYCSYYDSLMGTSCDKCYRMTERLEGFDNG